MTDSKKCYKGFLSLLLSLVLVFAFSAKLYAMPASPKLIKAVQRDGSTISVRIQGDEFFNWRSTEDGYPVVEQDGYYYYANYKANGAYEVSNQRVSINGVKVKPTSEIKRVDMNSLAADVAKVARVNRAQTSENLLETGFPSEGDVRSIVILVEYDDVKFTVENPHEAFNNQLNQEGYSVEGATGSARDYFHENSHGKFNGQFDVYGPYTLSQPQRYYGGNQTGGGGDIRPQDMIIEAVKLADQDGVDFSQYDFNDDGYIDNIFVYYAGRSEAEGGSSDCIWPHKWNVEKQPVHDGKILDVYACSSELRGGDGEPAIICGIGTFCHEFSHVFGLADHYDTTGSANGTSYGLGDYDIMTTGGYNNDGNTPPLHNALERMMIGWVDPIELDKEQSIVLEPINEGVVYKMSTDIEGEFFLFENRNRSASVWDYYTPGDGLFITHVDQSAPYVNAWNLNQPNGDASHECFRFVVAGNVALDYYTGWDKVPYPYTDLWSDVNSNNEWSPNTKPKSQSWSGEMMPFQLTDIALDGVNVTFNVSKATVISLQGTVKDAYGDYVGGASIVLTNNDTSEKFTGETNRSGMMIFDTDYIPNGNYTIVVTADSYAEYTKTFDLIQGAELFVTLYSEAQSSMSEICHHNGEYHHALGSSYQIRPMAIIPAEMLKKHIGCSIKEVRFYAAAPFEGQVIIQPGLIGAGWSPGSMEVTEADLGWYTVDFSGLGIAGGDVIIEPNTDYYVKVMMNSDTQANPALGMDNSTDRSLYSLSSLIDEAGSSPTTIYDFGGIDGNLMISLALSKESCYVAPIKFNPNPLYTISGIDLNVNETLPLVWGVTPANGNPACNWSSSDQSVVTVSSNGTLYGVAEGEATVTGVSVIDPSVKMTFTVRVGITEAKGKGRVVKSNTEEGVANITLKFYQVPADVAAAPKATADQKRQLRIQSVEALTKINIDKFNVTSYEGKDFVTATSDSEGYFQVDGLVAGSKYLIALEQDTYLDPWCSTTKTTYYALTAYDPADQSSINDLGTISLRPNALYGSDRFSYYEGEPELTSIGDGTSPVQYAIRIPAEDLKDKIGYQMTHIEGYVYNLLDPYIEAIIFTLDHNGNQVFQGGTSHGDLDTNPTNGHHIFEFPLSDTEPAIIRPETDYYVTIKMMGEMGAQTSADNAHDGESNLIWSDEDKCFKSITEMGMTESVDWQMSMFAKYRAIDPVNSISVSVADASMIPCVGTDFALTALSAPTTATYTDVVWSSSDEKIATIDEYGVAQLLKDGKVTFTATSVKYPDVKGTLAVNVTLMQGIFGSVLNSDGHRVAGAEVTFYPAIYATTKQGSLDCASYTRTSDVGLSVVSDKDGDFYIDLEEGVYEIEVKAKGLMDYQGLATVNYGLNNIPVMMYQYVDKLSDFMCYTEPGFDTSIGDEGYNFVPFTRWDAEDLEAHVGKQITRFKALVLGAANVRFVIFTPEADGYLYRSSAISIADGTLDMVVHDIPMEEYVTIEAGKEYCIGYEVSGYEQGVAPAVISKSSPTVAGKSDCIVYRGEMTDVTSLSNGISIGSWMLGFYLQDAEQQKGLNITVGQKDAVVSWNPGAYSSFILSYGKEGGILKNVTLDDCQYEMENLEVGTKYDIKISAVQGIGSNVELISSSFTTLEQKSTIPMVRLSAYNGYKVGEILNLKSLNTEPSDDVEWYVNSVKLPRNAIVLESGKHKIQCRVTRGSRSFVTTRYINVE